jgi:hypothetical protein
MILLFLVACQKEEPDEVDVGPGPEELVLPDTTGVDMEASFADGLALALAVRADRAWNAHVATLPREATGCPDTFVGAPETEIDLGVDDDAAGRSWADHCETDAGVTWAGALWWEATASASGDASTPEGATFEGERRLSGDGTVSEGADVRFELDGEVSDSLSRTTAPDYEHWTYATTVDATFTGSDTFAGTDTPDGYRADAYVYAVGGDAETLEARANVYTFDATFDGRFDSVSMELTMVSPDSASPDECALEPTGWISLRDSDAYWYDLVFQPADGGGEDTGYTDDPYAECDGCGTLYLRGVQIGEVCPDFSFVWDGRLQPPAPEDFVDSFHDVP